MAMSNDEIRRRIEAWLRRVLATTGWNARRLAAECGFSQSNLTRALDENDTYVLGTKHIARIMEVTGLPAPFEAPRAGFRGDDMEPYEEENAGALRAALAPGRGPVDLWRVATSSLEDAGYLPGDLVIVDPQAEPRPGDAVLAHAYDFESGTARTVLRLYQPPFLVSAAPGARPAEVMQIDGAAVRGVVVATVRLRDMAAA